MFNFFIITVLFFNDLSVAVIWHLGAGELYGVSHSMTALQSCPRKTTSPQSWHWVLLIFIWRKQGAPVTAMVENSISNTDSLTPRYQDNTICNQLSGFQFQETKRYQKENRKKTPTKPNPQKITESNRGVDSSQSLSLISKYSPCLNRPTTHSKIDLTQSMKLNVWIWIK